MCLRMQFHQTSTASRQSKARPISPSMPATRISCATMMQRCIPLQKLIRLSSAVDLSIRSGRLMDRSLQGFRHPIITITMASGTPGPMWPLKKIRWIFGTSIPSREPCVLRNWFPKRKDLFSLKSRHCTSMLF